MTAELPLRSRRVEVLRARSLVLPPAETGPTSIDAATHAHPSVHANGPIHPAPNADGAVGTNATGPIDAARADDGAGFRCREGREPSEKAEHDQDVFHRVSSGAKMPRPAQRAAWTIMRASIQPRLTVRDTDLPFRDSRADPEQLGQAPETWRDAGPGRPVLRLWPAARHG
jgi:hypothetical protein